MIKKIIKPYCLILNGLFLICLVIIWIILKIIENSIFTSTISDCLTWFFLSSIGIILMNNKYIYTDKYFIHYIFNKGFKIPLNEIIYISNNDIIGIFHIQTNERFYFVPLLFQKKDLKLFSEYLLKANNNCKVVIK